MDILRTFYIITKLSTKLVTYLKCILYILKKENFSEITKDNCSFLNFRLTFL
jgi:hypothetical protein